MVSGYMLRSFGKKGHGVLDLGFAPWTSDEDPMTLFDADHHLSEDSWRRTCTDFGLDFTV